MDGIAVRAWPPGLRPSEQLEDLMMGRIAWEDAQPGIRSWAERYFHDAACQILDAPDKATRRRMLLKIPETVRPQVERAARDLWARRRGRGAD